MCEKINWSTYPEVIDGINVKWAQKPTATGCVVWVKAFKVGNAVELKVKNPINIGKCKHAVVDMYKEWFGGE